MSPAPRRSPATVPPWAVVRDRPRRQDVERLRLPPAALAPRAPADFGADRRRPAPPESAVVQLVVAPPLSTIRPRRRTAGVRTPLPDRLQRAGVGRAVRIDVDRAVRLDDRPRRAGDLVRTAFVRIRASNATAVRYRARSSRLTHLSAAGSTEDPGKERGARRVDRHLDVLRQAGLRRQRGRHVDTWTVLPLTPST